MGPYVISLTLKWVEVTQYGLSQDVYDNTTSYKVFRNNFDAPIWTNSVESCDPNNVSFLG